MVSSAAAFEIAAAMVDPPESQRKQLEVLLLLAHCIPDLLRYPCRDLAAAAVLVSLRLCGDDGSELPPSMRTADACACAALLWAAHQRMVGRLAPAQAA